MTNRSLATMLALNEISREPFVWGRSDCCATAARVAQAVTGKLRLIALEFDSEEKARAYLDSVGGLMVAVTLEVGSSVPVQETRDGDSLLLDLPGSGQMLGVRLGDRVACRTKTGMISVPVTSRHVLCGWRVD